MLMERLEHALTRRPQDAGLLAVVFIDLDKFKSINDRHSHDAGDHVLKVVAGRIQELVRPHDTVVRWGGDEFLVLLDHVEDQAAALAVAQRITAAIAETLRRDGDDVSVTASVGVAITEPGEHVGVDALITRADAAMYDAKRAGGNRCSTSPLIPHQRERHT
jgi:diguanylate cyclase (GGDEF)-like protein